MCIIIIIKDAFKRDLADSKLFSENANWAKCTTDQLFSSYDVTLRGLLDKHVPICKVT